MTRWLMAYDDSIVDADTAQEAAEAWFQRCQLDIGVTMYAIDVAAIEGTDRLHHIRIGAVEVEAAP